MGMRRPLLPILAAVVFVGFLVYSRMVRGHTHPGAIPAVEMRVDSLIFAAMLYHRVHGTFPSGDSRAVAQVLMGNSGRSEAFIEAQAWTNAVGEVCDPWGIPYRFDFASNRVTVISSGPNGRMGDADDVSRSRPIEHDVSGR